MNIPTEFENEEVLMMDQNLIKLKTVKYLWSNYFHTTAWYESDRLKQFIVHGCALYKEESNLIAIKKLLNMKKRNVS